MMTSVALMAAFLDSLKDPFVFVDAEHVIRYMNKAARDRYKGRPAEIGRSIFDCHNEHSNKIILDVFDRLRQGTEEEIITDNEDCRVFMRAVRDRAGNLVGYYERSEPPGNPGSR
jgi:DUF438 domain-containing protein